MLNASDAGSLINFRGKLIESLVRRGHEVHVSAPKLSDGVKERLRAYGATAHEVRLARTGTNPIADISYALSLLHIMRAVRPDRVIGYTIKPNIWGSIAAIFVNARSASMVTGLGLTFIPGGGWKRRILQSVMRNLYAFATRSNDRVVFQNPDDRKDFIRAGCLSDPTKAVLVNGSGVDLLHYAPTPLPDKPVFLMISRLLASKGVREYAQAAISVLLERDDCRFLLVGFIDEGPDAVSQAELDHWRAAGIEYRGPLQDVRPALTESSVYVLPSYREGTPRSVLEAMSMGRPVITTDVPGCRETVENGVNGFLVAERSAKAVHDAMEVMANDGALRARFGHAGRILAEKKYAVDTVNDVLLQHLKL